MSKNNKTPLYALAALGLVGLIGGTFAVFSDAVSFENVFKTSSYATQTTEVFTAPEDWKVGDTTNKTVVTENTGDTPIAVRVKMTEKWEPAANPGEATINLANTDKWTKNSDGYYVYNEAVAPGNATVTPISSVTYTKAAGISGDGTSNCTSEEVKEDNVVTGKIFSCKSGDTATYTLTIDVETIQAGSDWAKDIK